MKTGIFKIALKNAENGAFKNVLYWMQNYENGLCTLPVAVKEILISLGLAKYTDEVEEYEEKAQKMVENKINNLIKNENN